MTTSRLLAFQNLLGGRADLAFIPLSTDLHYLAGIARDIPKYGVTLHPGDWLEGAWVAPGHAPVLALPRMTAEFGGRGAASGIDVRVLLMTAYPDPNAAESIDTGVCIDPPLGGGGCPLEDDNQPIFAHMQQIIGSEHALAKILSTYDNWKPMMRPDSVKHIIVVSDDDSYVSAAI